MTPMMNSAAVSASDSASTDGPPAAKNDGTSDGDEEQYARQLECQEVLVEQGLSDRANCIQLFELLLVEVGRDHQRFGQRRAQNHHDLAQQSKSNEAGDELPPLASCRRQLG